jgi:CubicO group peptidase (beta-lactamase class C family)
MTAVHEQHEVVDPAEIGLDPPRLRALVDRARREVDDGLLPSCQLAVAREGRLGLFETIGDATPSSRYCMFSATKAVVAAAVWLLIDDGTLDVTRLVADLIPEFGANGKDVVTVEQVLLHESGFPHAPLPVEVWGDRAARLRAFADWALDWEPGSRYVYHPTSAHWVLAELIERLAGQDYRIFVRRRVLEPHGLGELTLGVAPGDQGDVAPLGLVGEDVTPDELEALLGVRELDLGPLTPEMLLDIGTPAGLAAGVPGGGAVSTAADLALFYQALLHDPAGVWSSAALHGLTAEVRSRRPDVAGIPVNRTLGLVVAGDDNLAPMRGYGTTVGPRTFGHAGAGGQLAWADPDSGISFTYLTNGIDRHYLREWGRSSELNTLAGQCRRDR